MMHSDKIIETLNRIKINQKIVKNIRDAVSAACEGSKAYKDAQELFRTNREKMREIERQNMSLNDLQQLDNAKQAIKDDKQLLSDIALTAYAKGEDIEIKEDGAQYIPVITVKYQMKLL